MSQARGFVGSTIGRKVIMAVTGAILFGFVLVHMIGNLQVYLGPEALNHYGVFLREMLHGAGLWIARAASSGYSQFVDPLGRVRGSLATGEAGVLSGLVRLAEPGTPYTRAGWLLAPLCLAATLACLLVLLVKM